MKKLFLTCMSIAAMVATSATMAGGHSMAVSAANQDVSGGTVTAMTVLSEENGWLVIHRTDDTGKPGPVVGHAPLKKGENKEVVAILTERVASGEKLMVMLHGEAGGMKTGIFEYSLGAKEDGPVKSGGKLVMSIITAE